MRIHLFRIAVSVGLIFSGLSAQADEIRAIWVTRWDYTTADDVRDILDNIASHNFNTVLFQVRGNGTTFYPSALEPRAWELSGGDPSSLGTDPGWDPLALAVEYGHSLGLEIHAYMNTYPGWRGTEAPPTGVSPEQLWNAHPDWFCVDSSLNPMTLNSGYVVLSPGVLAVQQYLADIYEEVVTNYDVDGIHFDYVRYYGDSYSWDPESLSRFAAEYPGAVPRSDEWYQWRRDQVTALVSQVEGETHAAELETVVSAAVWSNHESGRITYGQDAWHWLAEGYLDVSHPMIYTASVSTHRTRTQEHMANVGDRQVSAGIGAHLLESNPSTFLAEIETTRNLGAHGCTLFAYTSLFNENTHAPKLLADVLIEGPFHWPDNVPPRRWLETVGDDDNTGPRIFNPRTEPEFATSGIPFNIRVDITDVSGVFDDETGPEGQGVFLRWAEGGNPASGEVVTMSDIGGGVYQTDEPLTATAPAGSSILFQVTAFDDDADDGASDRASRESAILAIDIFESPVFVFDALVGPVLSNPQYAVMDHRGMLWVCDYGAKAIRIFDTEGNPAAFDPITQGLNGAGETIDIDSPSGIACAPDGTIWVTLDDAYTAPLYSGIVRFDSQTGTPLVGMDLTFRPGDCDIDANGNLYAVEKLFNRWHLFTQSSGYQASSEFGSGATRINRALACFDDGSLVLVACQDEGAIQAYERTSSNPPAYARVEDYSTITGLSGGVDADAHNWVYAADVGNDGVLVIDETGDIVQVLQSSTNPITDSRGVAYSADGNEIYLVQFKGNSQLQRWVRINPLAAGMTGLAQW